MSALRPGTLDARPVKRSVTIGGHATSFSLEEPFWQALRDEAARRRISLARLVTMVDTARGPGTNLSSALRIHVLNVLGERLAGTDAATASEPPSAEGSPSRP